MLLLTAVLLVGMAAQSDEQEARRLFEEAERYYAVGKFERALESYEAVLANPVARKARSIEWERALRSSLAIAVRVKKDPDRALRIVERALESPEIALFVREQARQWRASLQEWKKELGRLPSTEEGLHAEAVRLFAAAKTLQKYPADRAADVLYLRALASVHDLLSAHPDGKYAAEAL